MAGIDGGKGAGSSFPMDNNGRYARLCIPAYGVSDLKPENAPCLEGSRLGTGLCSSSPVWQPGSVCSVPGRQAFLEDVRQCQRQHAQPLQYASASWLCWHPEHCHKLPQVLGREAGWQQFCQRLCLFYTCTPVESILHWVGLIIVGWMDTARPSAVISRAHLYQSFLSLHWPTEGFIAIISLLQSR